MIDFLAFQSAFSQDITSSPFAIKRTSDFGYISEEPDEVFDAAAVEEEFRVFGFVPHPPTMVDAFTQIHDYQFRWTVDADDAKTSQFLLNDALLSGEFWDEGEEPNQYFCDEMIGGAMSVPGIDEILTPNRDAGYTYVAQHLGLDPQNYTAIDFVERFTAVLPKSGNRLIDRVMLFDNDAAQLHDMQLSFERYFEIAFSVRCFFGWQHAWVHRKKSIYYEMLKSILPVLLPSTTPSVRTFGS